MVAFTVLHSGGKFDKECDGAYKVRRRLHGVGVAVTNALSKRSRSRVPRSGHTSCASSTAWPRSRWRKSAPAPRTRPAPWCAPGANSKYFDAPNVTSHSWNFRCAGSRAAARVTHHAEFRKVPARQSVELPDGCALPGETLSEFELATPSCCRRSSRARRFQRIPEGGRRVLGASPGRPEGNVVRESYVNLIPTPSGGPHEAGLRDGIFNSVKSFAELHGLCPRA